MAALYKFRIRRGFGGVCVLQQLTDGPLITDDGVNPSIRRYAWKDVKYDFAPPVWEPVELNESKTDE